MKKKIRVGVLYGGRSGEHEVSVRSARSVLGAIDAKRYDVCAIGVERSGAWRCKVGAGLPDDVVSVGDEAGPHVVLTRGGELMEVDGGGVVAQIDVIFPILHGPFGEDGTVQGLCEVHGVPYVGAGVLGSAIGMDKDVHKRLLREAGLPIVPFEAVRAREWERDSEAVKKRLVCLGDVLFVKPANLGSSVGISRVCAAGELEPALRTAFEFDRKAVVERGIDAREIECAVLGDDEPRVSVAGEIAPGADFYSYDDKYAAGSTAELLIPAPLEDEQSGLIREIALRVYRVLELRGMARVDFFIERGSGKIFVNEPNTIPGFTSISMYPKLWEASGLPYSMLISKLIELALERA